MNTIILCPHQDDEILSSFLLMHRLRKNGDKVTIIFATNGDYHGKKIAEIRYMESVQALSLCDIEEDNILYMGYGDTGMRKDHSFLNHLYCTDLEQPYSSGCSRYTYHPTGLETIHHKLYGKEAPYTKAHFLVDLRDIIHILAPDLLIVPSIFDAHGDHYALAKFVQKAIPELNGISLSYIIHAENDLLWPPRDNKIWTRPTVIPENMWRDKITVKNVTAMSLKLKAIQCFKSQNPYGQNRFLLAFAKPEEIYLCNYPTINKYLPTE